MVGASSLSAKRSEQNKNGRNKNWVVQWNKCEQNKNEWNKKAEQKISGIKIGGDLWTLSGGDSPSLSAKRSEQNKNWVLATKCSKVPTNFCSADFYSAGLRNFYSALTFLHLALGVPVTQCPKIPTNF